MSMKKRSLLCLSILALTASLGLAGQAQAASRTEQVNGVQADQMPAVSLNHWKSSSVEEQNAFLFGFLTMLSMDREWRQGAALPVKQSLSACWSKGFNGVSIQDMRAAIDAYAAAHPENQDRQVVEVLWLSFVQPKLTPKERKDVAAAYKAWRTSK